MSQIKNRDFHFENGDDRLSIVLTGGPGAGKTTAADLFRRELGEKVIIVPEAATLLFSGGFPRLTADKAICKTQRAIYHTQRNLEDVIHSQYMDRVLLCDRGTVDSAAYWPHGPEHFFDEMYTDFERELNRYDAVVFFESAAAGGISIEGGNPIRTENLGEARKIDKELQKLWSHHKNFHFIPHQKSFFSKISTALIKLQEIVDSFSSR